MGCASSKAEKDEALLLCKERKKFMKIVIDRRYGLAAAHVAYIQSLHKAGDSLLRFAKAEAMPECSTSTYATTETTERQIAFADKSSPSHSSNFPSPLPGGAPVGGGIDSPQQGSPLSPIFLSPQSRSTVSFMKSGGTVVASTFQQRPPELGSVGFVEDSDYTMSPTLFPPRPPPGMDPSWDFFDPVEDSDNLHSTIGGDGFSMPFETSDNNSPIRSSQNQRSRIAHAYTFTGFPSERLDTGTPPEKQEARNPKKHSKVHDDDGHENMLVAEAEEVPSTSNALEVRQSRKEGNAVDEKEMASERKDASEFITHRAKDFLSSIEEIKNWFQRACEAGKEVSRMLEANKVQPTCTEFRDGPQLVTKVISWHRSTSSRSFSSRSPLVFAPKDDIDDSSSDFVEDFCMISGSHSSTLDRMYAWERKLHDEVKASESVRKEYDRKCGQLRHQSARDLKKHVIDKTRAAVKDLYSRTNVAIQALESISKRIEKLRDEELQPQLLELIQGSIRMWKIMLECHHAQYITISLAYHTKASAGAHTDSRRDAALNLENEMSCLSTSFTNYLDAQKSYVQALNCWLTKCVRIPVEKSTRRGRNPFSPRRALAPPIFVLCRDWSAAFDTLPAGEVLNAIKALTVDVHGMSPQPDEHQKLKPRKKGSKNLDSGVEQDGQEDKSSKRSEAGMQSNLSSIHSNLILMFEKLKKFAEASLKMYEDIRQGMEAACIAYNGSGKGYYRL
ncbi:hypothetical protein EJ110_NYTH00781 [Nymphaea thermarum]|nr:hypothetical protein EJ110_NYTH00781 [Nymphaea thermarum]